ncbi:MAG: hypothetical protein ABI877_20425 [Gemmatimonadaceae bacterium]
MPGRQLRRFLSAEMDRRTFLSAVGTTLAGASVLGVASACAGDGAGLTTPDEVMGTVRGSVVDMSGNAQSVGRVYLLQKNGLNTDLWTDPNLEGRFDFGAVEVGEYQLRYWGANLARVPESLLNPVPVSVRPGTPTEVRFQIILGAASNLPQRDIYIGDYFFQEQPSGSPNATVIVKFGTNVCWYNVGTMPHTVTGGPWGDSGPIGLTGNYIWPASEIGTFQYSCSFHRTQMTASLQVVR